MRKSCAIIRHLAFEDPGFLGPLLNERGYEVTVLEPGIDDLALAQLSDLLVVLGGPIGVYETDAYPWIGEELAVIGARLKREAAILGICLGAQLIARAAGAQVYPGDNGKEIGWAPVILTAEGQRSPLSILDRSTPVLHWHGDTFDLPPGAILLASTDRYRTQAFAIGTNVLGLQFHIEVDPSYTERWLVGHAVELANAAVDVPGLRSANARQGQNEETARSVFSRWLDDIGRTGSSDL